MPRYLLLVEYDGGPFRGWQRQASGPSVQERLERAISAFSGAQVAVCAAGRTDAGVHALLQPVHVDLPRAYAPETLVGAINHHLRPDPIAVLEAREVDPSFHARFSALKRRYLYRILNRRAPPALLRGRVWHVVPPLCAEHMQEAAQRLVGRHDFTSFRAAECQARSAVKTLDLLVVERRGEMVEVRAEARSFLHHQVRNMVGSLVLIGLGRRPVAWIEEVREARDRRRAGPTAPASGLFFAGARYPGLDLTRS